MRKLFCLMLVSLLAVTSYAQKVKPEFVYGKYGLKNFETGQWVVKPVYNDARYLGSYEGRHYYGVRTEDNLWGFFRSDDFSKYHISPRFAAITWWAWRFPVVGVQVGGNWGVIELYTDQASYLVNCTYKEATMSMDEVGLRSWDGSYREVKLGPLFEKALEKARKIDEANRKLAQEAKRKEEERLSRIQKEKELASFTEYARNYVTPRVNDWQKKGEFEKIADYQQRVTGANRLAKIDEYTAEAERLFLAEHAALDPIRNMTLEMYDSESEVFSIISDKFGQLLLPVLIADGPSFKANFASVVKRDPVYFIENDKVALKSLIFVDSVSGRSFKYSNNAALNYSSYEINPDDLDIESVRITSTATTTVHGNIKPTCEIISPRKGSTYSSETITIQYNVKVAEGLDSEVRISVNGKVVQPRRKTGAAKGVRLVDCKEMEVDVPRNIGETCVLTLQPMDSEGTWGEPKSVEIRYVGERPKPGLHIFAVGVSDYQANDLERLSYAAKDARDFVKTISSSDLSMYSACRSVVMTDREATAVNIKRSLNNLSSSVPQGDVVFVYFSGHGIKENGEAYFISTETSAAEYYNGVEFEFIKKRLNIMSAEKKCHVVLFMDTCHSGAMHGMKGITKDFAMSMPGVVGFYSSTEGQQSAELDTRQNGVFTSALIDALKGKASNGEGEITLHGLTEYIYKEVKQATGGRQDPIVENGIGDAVLFRVK